MFYDNFVRLCAGAGKSPSAVAQELGINKSSVSNWKRRKNGPSDVTMQKIADYFGVSVGYLLDAEENTDSVINDISQYQALLAWLLDNEEVPDELKYVIQAERPKDLMAALSALSYQAGARFDSDTQEKTPTPVSESGQDRNIIKIAGRDGSFVERELTDSQLSLMKNMLDQLKPIDDERI